ncbi:FecR domain-containing protein [Rhodoferax sp.]|uniref:FecR domain-containing protein n=3 Tax=Rhodoferax sp. TaxID=50421 RepID=UPI0032648E8E
MPIHLPHFRRLQTGLIGLVLWGTPWWAMAADFIYTVQPGDHPWNLAERYLKRPSLALALRQRNQIADDHRIPPGTQLRIPKDWLKLESTQVTLLAVAGDTMLRQGSTPARAAIAGERLQAPSGLHTGPDGSATLQFADGSRVLVRRDSELQLQTTQKSLLGQASIVALSLLQGSVENQVTPLGDSGGRFEIQTPAAIAAVRGTQYRVYTDGQTMRTEVLTGAVHVANPTGQVTALAAQGTVAQSGSSPAAPIALLPPPSLDGLPDTIERLPIAWPITPLAGASQYRSQLAATPEFSAMLSDEVVDSARMRVRDIDDGSYVLRVRGIDAQGLEGLSAQRTLVIHTQPEPPLLIDPASDAATTAARPNLRWTQGEASLQYRVQLSTHGTAVDEQVVSSASAQPPQDLAPGIYQWRVAAIHPTKGQGPWGDAQAFRRVLPGPGVDIPQPQDGSLTLRWTAQPQTAHYHLQVARDDHFSNPLADADADTSQFSLKDLQPGPHYVRVQATGTDGYAGPWGSTQTFVVPQPPPSRWPALLLLLPALAFF